MGRQEVPWLSQHLREKGGGPASSKCEVLWGRPPRKSLQAQQAAPWRHPSLVVARCQSCHPQGLAFPG